MFGQPSSPGPAPASTRYSPDGHWWWDGAEWKPALSADRLWRWNGQAWVPAQPAAAASAGGGGGLGTALTVGLGVLVLVLVGAIVLVILLTMGGQIANVLSNLVVALGA